MIVNVFDVPSQFTPPPLNLGVTVMVATTADVPVFVAVKAAIFPEPLAASPIDGVLFVQLNVGDPVPEKVTRVVELLLHTTWFVG